MDLQPVDHLSQHIGITYDPATRRVVAILDLDDDAEFDDPAHTAQGLKLIMIPRPEGRLTLEEVAKLQSTYDWILNIP